MTPTGLHPRGVQSKTVEFVRQSHDTAVVNNNNSRCCRHRLSAHRTNVSLGANHSAGRYSRASASSTPVCPCRTGSGTATGRPPTARLQKKKRVREASQKSEVSTGTAERTSLPREDLLRVLRRQRQVKRVMSSKVRGQRGCGLRTYLHEGPRSLLKQAGGEQVGDAPLWAERSKRSHSARQEVPLSKRGGGQEVWRLLAVASLGRQRRQEEASSAST